MKINEVIEIKAERLFLNATIQETVRTQRKATKCKKRPEELLCDVLNRFTPEQRRLIAEMLK